MSSQKQLKLLIKPRYERQKYSCRVNQSLTYRGPLLPGGKMLVPGPLPWHTTLTTRSLKMCVLTHLPGYWCELQSLGITEELQMEVKAWERAILNIFVDKELRNRCIQSFVPNHIASKSGFGVKAFSGEFYWL